MKILVIRFSSIGDIVLTTPVVRCLKQQVENAEVHFITKKETEQLLSANPYIDKLLFLQDSIWQTIQLLRQEKYDYVIDLHNNQRTFLIKTFLGAKSFSFRKLNWEKWLMVHFKINRLPAVHIVDRYLNTVKALGIVNDGKGLDFFIQPNVNDLQTNEGKYIAWAIGAKQKTKQFPVHKIVAALNAAGFPNIPVVLLGGKEDVTKAEEIIAATANRNVKSQAGKLSLQQSALIVKKATLLITNDTGLMHIGAALRKPIVSIWGNTIPEFGMTPYYGNRNIGQELLEVKHLNCRPCSKLGFEQCPKGNHHCMNQISNDEMMNAINKLLGN